jgi:lipoprotein NlpD
VTPAAGDPKASAADAKPPAADARPAPAESKPVPPPSLTERPDADKDSPAAEDDSIDWSWPVRGDLLYRFGESGRLKGVGIAGRSGQPIAAAAAGRVVYSGSGLRGYGRLVIVKHNETYLSVYAHNSALAVKEGDVVKRGQKIAEMGDSDATRVGLHFEIRRFGKPLDPLGRLPGG